MGLGSFWSAPDWNASIRHRFRGARRERHTHDPASLAPPPEALRKCYSEQARAEQHKAGCGYREEPIGPEVMIAHGHHLSLGNSDHRLDYRAPARTERRRTVKRISSGSEKRNLMVL
jgi:hypothetical protein